MSLWRRRILVILPAYQKDGAVSIARDIKDAFDHVILHAGAYHDIVRLSIGVAGIRDEETIQDLLNKCDQRMYISKEMENIVLLIDDSVKAIIIFYFEI